ncbi:MAG: hypothetical protein ACLQVI_21550 [Polyangiaceae bacterium]
MSYAEVFSVGLQDLSAARVVVDDPQWSPFFVHATSPRVAASVLVERVGRLLTRMGEFGRQSLNFRCDREAVAVEWLGDEPLPDLFDLACDLLSVACEPRTRSGAYR